MPPTIKPWKILRKWGDPSASPALNFSPAGNSFAKTSGGAEYGNVGRGKLLKKSIKNA
jgi:hypothetical protein